MKMITNIYNKIFFKNKEKINSIDLDKTSYKEKVTENILVSNLNSIKNQETKKLAPFYLMLDLPVNHEDLIYINTSPVNFKLVYCFIGKDFDKIRGFLDSMNINYEELV